VQLKAGTLMSRESTGSRCEQLAQQLLVYGRPLPLSEVVGRIDAVSDADVVRVMRRLSASAPTLTALGPIGRVEALGAVAERLH